MINLQLANITHVYFGIILAKVIFRKGNIMAKLALCNLLPETARDRSQLHRRLWVPERIS